MQPINKALTPEEQAIVGNIKSLLTQLEGAVVGGGELPVEMSGTPTDAESIVGKSEDPDAIGGQPNKIGKDETMNAGSPSGHAQQTMDELPVDDEEALGVLKSLLGLGGKTVQKSSLSQTRRYAAQKGYGFEAETLKVLKSLVRRSNEQELILQALVNGQEVADSILKIEKSAPKLPVQPSANDIMAALGQLVQKSEKTQPQDAGSMADVLRGIWA